MTRRVPRILVVGSINVDAHYTMQANQVFSSDGKVNAQDFEFRLGGGGGNCVQALHKLDEAFDTQTSIQFITYLGRPTAHTLESRITHEIARELLDDNEIRLIDAVRGKNAIAFNAVTEHAKGRLATKQDVDPSASLAYGIEDTIDTEVRSADVIFIDPRKATIGQMAALAAEKHNKPLMVDWGESAWPDDPQLAQAYETILNAANIIVVPTDAIVRGMENNTENPEELFARLRDEFKIPNILMSNGGDSVRALVEGREHSITVQKHDGFKYRNAAGDTRNAGVLRHLSHGHDVLSAFQYGTAVASVKVKYPGLEWADRIAEEINTDANLPEQAPTDFPIPNQD